uniref:Transforming growth factor, alpha n=1 Tax=Poecilia reticulata TaxID=8081 RepID=A0A3P9N1U9_POERE
MQAAIQTPIYRWNGECDEVCNAAICLHTPFSLTEFVAAAVRSHFDDCPDSHRHFCFHGTCRFLILEETPACVCHPGFVGMRCEHADLLAVVATNHRKQAVATVLVLCVIGCVLIMVLSKSQWCGEFRHSALHKSCTVICQIKSRGSNRFDFLKGVVVDQLRITSDF